MTLLELKHEIDEALRLDPTAADVEVYACDRDRELSPGNMEGEEAVVARLELMGDSEESTQCAVLLTE